MCRELEKWSMEERQEGQRKGEDNLAKLLKLLKADGRLRDLDLAIEDEAARKALYKEYQHRLKKSPEAIEIVDSIRGFICYQGNQPLRSPQAVSSPMRRAFLEACFGQFVFHGPAVPVDFPPFLSDFAGQVQAFRIGAEFFQINNTESFWSDFVDS